MKSLFGNLKIQNRGKSALIFGVIVFALLILVVGFLTFSPEKFSQQKEKVAVTPTPSPVVKLLRKEAAKIKRGIVKTDKRSGDLVIEDNSEFNITYLISNDQFIVTIKSTPYDLSKQKVEKWFQDKGFTAEDLCLLKISFAASKEIKLDFSGKDAVPIGCPLPKPKIIKP